MTIKESAEIVYQLHAAYPTDRKATENDLLSRIETFSITFADYDFSTVKLAVKHCINSNKFMPTVQEILTATKLLTTIGNANFIGPEELSDDQYDEQLEAFCRWIGLGVPEQEKNFTDYEL